MGGGSYSYLSASSRSATRATMDRAEIFLRSSIDKQMVIKGKVRECCETEEHPETFPIIIGLDVTGSMGHVPERLIKNDFAEIMKKIIDAGVKCPQVCFVAFGDALDNCPIQVGQFEADDSLMEKWLTLTYIEGHGCGNGHEDPEFVYYFANHHTNCDAIEKRGKKGLLITISDDCVNKYMRPEDAANNFGDYVEGYIQTKDLIADTSKNWEIYHINYEDYLGHTKKVKDSWKKYLGDHVIHIAESQDANFVDVIADIAIRTYESQYNGSVSTVSSIEPEEIL